MKNTKTHILSTSLRYFLKKGFSDVSMSELVKASGLSKGAFYHYFSSKEQLYEETLNVYFFSFLENFIMDYDDKISFRDNMRKIYTSIVEMMDEIDSIIGDEIHIISYYRTIWESMSKNPGRREAVKKYYTSYMDSFNQWIEKAKQNGEIRQDLNNRILALHMASLIEGTLVVYSFQDSELNLNKMFDEIYKQFCNLISPSK